MGRTADLEHRIDSLHKMARSHIVRLNDLIQCFEKNNTTLFNNWQDEQSIRFSQSILQGTTRIVTQLINQNENVLYGICPMLEQLVAMCKDLDTQIFAASLEEQCW